MPWKTKSPGKYIWGTGAVILNLMRLPLSALYYISKATRPHPQWTVLQSVMNTAMNSFLFHLASVEGVTALDLEPGNLGDRFTAIPKGPSSIFTGVALDEAVIPSNTGAIWFPNSPETATDGTGKPMILLHFHPGGYVMGDVRTDASFMAQMLTKRVAPGSHVCMSLYRLASNPGGQFPAALQDALSTYHFLVQDFPGSEIILTGDSAGGHIVTGLLRYIAEHGPETALPPPRCALLFSPAIDMLAALEPEKIASARNFRTDYLDPAFISWGARRFISDKLGAEPYINPLRSPFRSPCPIWTFCGGCELFFNEITSFVDDMRTVKGNKVELSVERLANHDIVFAGNLTGWRKEAEHAAD